MKNYRIDKVIEYFSLILVISFFIFHNINLVLIGITLSIYIINNNKISNKPILNKSIQENRDHEEMNSSKDIKNKGKILNKIDKESSLVEIIEELGYIPSKNKKDDIKAA